MVIFGVVCFIVGIVFFAFGLWPVSGFIGLDVAIVYLAFKSNYTSANAYELIEVTRHRVWLRKVSAKGKSTDYRFPQFGTRFETQHHHEIGITKMLLANRQQSVEFGYFLNPVDRESFATAFRRALTVAKR